MAKVQEFYNVGNREELTIEQLLDIIEDMYKVLAQAVNLKPDIIQRPSNGLSTDTFLSVGDININTSTLNVQILTAFPTISTVTWTTI